MIYVLIAIASLVSSGVIVRVCSPKLHRIDSLNPTLVKLILFAVFLVIAPLIGFLLFVVTGIIVLFVEGGYGYYSPTTAPQEVTAVRETGEARWRIEHTRVAATETASANATATAETAFPVLATRRAWLEGLRAQSDGYLDGVFDPCVPAAGAIDPCATGRYVE